MRPIGTRIPELDSLRGFAAIGVVLWHYSSHFQARPLDVVFQPFYEAGLYGVDFFFVLSGFVLTRAYLNEDRQYRCARNILDRVARLYPLHILTLIVVMLGQLYVTTFLDQAPYRYPYNDTYHFMLNLFLGNSIGLQEGMSFNGPAWSISVEFFVNLLFFWIIFSARRTWLVFSSLVTVALLGLILQRGHLIGSGSILWVVDSTLARGVLGFFSGALLFQIAQRLESANIVCPRLLLDVVFIAALAGVAVFFVNAGIRSSPGLDFAVALGAFPLVIYAAYNSLWVSRILRTRALVYLGEISYSIYLIHFPIQLLVYICSQTGLISRSPENPLSLCAFMAITLIASSLCYHHIELPMKRAVVSVAKGWIGPSGASGDARESSRWGLSWFRQS